MGFAIGTPLFQTSFLPDLTQAYSFPDWIEVCPSFLHAAPALVAAVAVGKVAAMSETTAMARSFCARTWQVW